MGKEPCDSDCRSQLTLQKEQQRQQQQQQQPEQQATTDERGRTRLKVTDGLQTPEETLAQQQQIRYPTTLPSAQALAVAPSGGASHLSVHQQHAHPPFSPPCPTCGHSLCPTCGNGGGSELHFPQGRSIAGGSPVVGSNPMLTFSRLPQGGGGGSPLQQQHPHVVPTPTNYGEGRGLGGAGSSLLPSLGVRGRGAGGRGASASGMGQASWLPENRNTLPRGIRTMSLAGRPGEPHLGTSSIPVKSFGEGYGIWG